MASDQSKKCAHIPCVCNVPSGQKFCSDSCEDGGSEEVEIACECGHPACAQTTAEITS